MSVAFTLSALAIAYGVRNELKPLVLFGASWLVLGIFIWWCDGHRTFLPSRTDGFGGCRLADVLTGFLQ